MMQRKVGVLTCNFGGYDTVSKPVPQTVPCVYVCLVDDAGGVEEENGWRLRSARDTWKRWDPEAPPHRQRFLNIYLARTHPLLFFDDHDPSEFSAIVYIDANQTFARSDAVEMLLSEARAQDADLLFFHNKSRALRDRVLGEVEASEHLEKYKNDNVRGAYERFVSDGFPDEPGCLLHNGVCVFTDAWSQQAKDFGDLYLREYVALARDPSAPHHGQGQVILPYILWKQQQAHPHSSPSCPPLRVATIPYPLWVQRWKHAKLSHALRELSPSNDGGETQGSDE